MDELEGPFSLFLVFMISMSIFLSLTAIEAFRGNSLIKVFSYTLITWTSYMSAHRILEGRFIDGKDPGKDMDEEMKPIELAGNRGFLVGTAFFVIGMTIGAYGLNISSLLTTVSGGVSFSLGYVIAHYSTTGKLL